MRPVWPNIKGLLELSLDWSLPLAMVHMSPCLSVVIRAAENIALQPVSCTKSSVCRAWHTPVSPQLTYWLLISHISLLQPWKNIPGFQRWTLSYSLTPSAKTLFLLHKAVN